MDRTEATGEGSCSGVGNGSGVSNTMDIDSSAVFYGLFDVFGVRNCCNWNMAVFEKCNDGFF